MADAGFFAASPHDPGSQAVFDANRGQWFTRAQLAAQVDDFAGRLHFSRKALGFHFGFPDAAGLIAYLAAIESGHAIVTLNPELDSELQSRLIARFQPDFLIAPASHPPAIPEGGPEYVDAGGSHDGQLLLRSRDPHRHPIHPDLTLLISTSGSSGSPKLVRLTWRNIETNARQINHALGNTERDRAMITTPIFNGYGQSVIHTHLLAGGAFVLSRERIVSREFWDAVRESECNSIGGTPYFYEVLNRLDLDALRVPRLTRFVQTGGRMPEHLARKYHAAAAQRGGALHLMYGQAEATARISGLPPEFLPEAARSIGLPLCGGALRIERDGVECATGEEGELVYRGPNVMMGYATGPEDLAKGDELGGLLTTGDLGYRDERGLFYITGRRARFVKLFGWRISLDDVEQMLSHLGPVAAVNLNDRIVVYAERNGEPMQGAVQSLASRLGVHPSGIQVRPIPSIPRLANGKTDYPALLR